MESHDPRARQWRKQLRQEMDDARMSQTQLSILLGVTQAMVSLWLKDGGRHGPPDPDVVFAMEDALGCPDRLSSVLGYVRPGPVPDVLRAIRQDEGLDQGQRKMLIDVYRGLTSGRTQRRS